MKKTKIIYWIFTGLLAALMLSSAVPDILNTKDARDIIGTQLRYPNYIVPFLGVMKLLGVIGLLVPNFPRLKEWVYAGFTFDLVGAVYSSFAVGATVVQNLPFLLFFALVAGSYIYHHKLLKAKETSVEFALA